MLVLNALAAHDGGLDAGRMKTRVMQLAVLVCRFPLNGCLWLAIFHCNCSVREADSPWRLICFKFNGSGEAIERLVKLFMLDFLIPSKDNIGYIPLSSAKIY